MYARPLPIAAALAVAALPFAALAEPTPAPSGEERDPAALIAYEHRTADRVTPLPGSARPFAEAKRQLARGEPKAALDALKGAPTGLLRDRVALLRGDALLALGKTKAAEKAYLEAIAQARVESVALLGARGLVDVYRQLDAPQRELDYVEALLSVRRISRRPSLMMRRAAVLRRLGRLEEAGQVAWRVLLDYPTARDAKEAEALLSRLAKRGVELPSSSARIELARIRNLIASRAWTRAEQAIEALEAANPKLSRALDMKRAELAKRQRRRAEETEILLKLKKDGLTDDDGPAILYRLGHLALNLDDNPAALRYFDELEAKYPDSDEADRGAYLAGWIPYNDGDYEEATRRMLAFAAARPRSGKVTEALWWAGWSAYVGKDHGRARRAFEQLIEDHPTSGLVPHARYWIGRIRQQANEPELARAAYRAVLESAPMSYYGFWSAARLEELGETTVLSPPPPSPPPASLREVLARLGASRPTNIDRGILLFAAGLEDETREELTEAGRFLRKVRDTEGRTMVADMLRQLGAHHMAFRIAARITADGAELERGEPWSWRAWRHAYPLAFEDEVKAAAKAHDVDPHLVLSIMRTESHYRPGARSPVGARGLMQLMPRTARLIGRKADGGRRHAARYRHPESNVWLGAWYVARLLERFEGQLPAAIGSYNGGPRAMEGWLDELDGRPIDEFVERIPYRETRRYVRRVLETLMIYRRLYGGDLPKLVAHIRDVDPEAGAVRF